MHPDPSSFAPGLLDWLRGATLMQDDLAKNCLDNKGLSENNRGHTSCNKSNKNSVLQGRQFPDILEFSACHATLAR